MSLLLPLVSAGLLWLIGNIAWSILRPERRTYPAVRRDGLVFRINELLGPASSVAIAAVILLGWNSLSLDAWLRFPLGSLLLAAGIYLSLGGVFTLGQKRTMGFQGELEASGPYRYSRNPQYVGSVIAFAGLSLLASSAPGFAITLLSSAWFLLCPFAEEPWLREKLGAPYERYAARVPRFLPLLPLALTIVATFAWVLLKPGPTATATVVNRVLFVVILAFAGWLAQRQTPPLSKPAARLAVGAVSLFFIGAAVLFGVHLGAILTLILRGDVFAYDFRFYSLVLLGVVAIIPAISGLLPGRSRVRAAALLLAINLPLIPLQDFAVAFTIAGVATLAILLADVDPPYFAD